VTFALYLHVPFCSALCPYCDFAVVVGRPELHERYLGALVDEVRAKHWGARAASMFVGGGTPTFVDPALLARTIETIREIVPFEPRAEITVEANPDSVSVGGLRALERAGVNRVSIGAQSFDDEVLRALGRTHAAADVGAAVAAARAAGIANVSLDLIFGAPGETDEPWRATLQQALALAPEHVSCYALTIEERTAFGTAVANATMRAPDEDALADRYEIAQRMLADAGYEQYEISNWARPGFACAHNLVYWTHGDYLGAGVGAHSHRDGRRWWNARALKRYLDDPLAAVDGEETLTPRQRAEEWLSLRVRLTNGFDLDAAARELGRAIDTEDLQREGLVRVAGARLALTPRGMLLENRVTARLLGL
jgi:oxygen-independent coproporphyrinogen-3 oxidase